MPIYEYQCDECHHKLEKLQKFSDSPLVDCPTCGKPALKKQISATGFQLKGSGWYAHGYTSSNQTSAKTNSCPSAGSCGASCPGALSSE